MTKIKLHTAVCFVQLLKDLPAVDNQLALKTPCRLAGTYCTNLGLYIVGILRKFHACLLVSQEQTASAFERSGSCRVLFSYSAMTFVHVVVFVCC